ncbi:MAG TPA: undecaprenyl-diphosphate phosphatase [Chromatiaceae bacterium]|jgi:undecaprenyl-diphosphatase|nr:undecaprenyl-diphosphate phosphatase [Chromatiaceae bacterium]HIA09186.1 undecaprenyl-diphosphate phosphatase [Chromatiaceae bacterium]HIN81551.1 undecaprenyl-diphosphate phosphatase [Chromatiales bacterium]HIO15010.1 undecaprenyl-diphosphate phosphatase [Chromatiales bacterium]HIO53562.1 undecaprenyl-diphosphate phosphatase [Chromatiales bacterium]
MDYFQAFVLALVQGLTEFLPVSSSAHLILVPILIGWEDQGLAFDVAVHVGSLVAVVGYFRHEVWSMTLAWFSSLGGTATADSRLAWAVVIGTVPVGLVGLFAGDYIEANLRSPLVLAYATIGFGLLLWFADIKGARSRDEYSMSWKDVMLIGIAQGLALIPGTSRSGITITMGLLLGLTRTAAARFSFLLSIPVIVLAGGMQTLELLEAGDAVVWGPLIAGMVLSALGAYTCIHWMLKLLDRIGMVPFVLYRLLLGTWLLVIFW